MSRYISSIIDYHRLDRRASNAIKLAQNTLTQYITDKQPDLIEEYGKWSAIPRNMNNIAIGEILEEELCKLEDMVFDDGKRQISIFVTASGRIFDDLLDEGTLNPKEIPLYLKTGKFYTQQNPSKELLYALGHRTYELLPSDFKLKNKQFIDLFFTTQVDSLKLKDKNISREEVVSIRDRKWGYYILFLYTLLCPQSNDPTIGLTPCYDFNNNITPATKSGAIFNLGAWFSRWDDLDDFDRDKENIKQLVTEGCISWDGLGRELEYVSTGLEKFYSPEKVKPFKQLLRTASNYNRIANNFGKVRARMRTVW